MHFRLAEGEVKDLGEVYPAKAGAHQIVCLRVTEVRDSHEKRQTAIRSKCVVRHERVHPFASMLFALPLVLCLYPAYRFPHATHLWAFKRDEKRSFCL